MLGFGHNVKKIKAYVYIYTQSYVFYISTMISSIQVFIIIRGRLFCPQLTLIDFAFG